jgi:hypothetical protein
MASQAKLMAEFRSIADELLEQGYDQALSNMLDMLDALSGEHGVDFYTHIAARVDPRAAPHLRYPAKRG